MLRFFASPVLLKEIAADTLVVAELGNKRISFLDLFKIDGPTALGRRELGVKRLGRLITIFAAKTTGIVEFRVTTRWPSVSLWIASRLLDGVNNFNQRTRHGQAEVERKFVESRLAVAGSDLRAAEDRLEVFFQTNREVGRSPQLTFQRDRLQRDVGLNNRSSPSLTQSYEEVRIREVRDSR